MLKIRQKPEWSEFIIYFVFLGIFLIFSVTLFDRGFLKPQNLMNIARQTAMIAIMAVGMTFVLSCAEIDLSFGSTVALSAVLTALMLRWTQNILLSVLTGLLTGLTIGGINGIFVGYVGIPSFLVTLGMMGIITGAARWVTQLQSIPVDNEGFAFIFGSGDLGPVPILFFWTLVVAVLGFLLLTRTPFGRKVLATGGNKVSAVYSGIKVRRITLTVFILNALLAALAGVLYTGRLQGARYTLGENDLMVVISAVIIGGTSLFGGKGRIVGSVVGALLMGMINNGLVLMNLKPDSQLIFRGLIIILSVTIMMKSGRRKN